MLKAIERIILAEVMANLITGNPTTYVSCIDPALVWREVGPGMKVEKRLLSWILSKKCKASCY